MVRPLCALQREHLVRPGDVHYAIHHHRRRFQIENGRSGKLHRIASHFTFSVFDLVEPAVPVAADIAVVGGPVAGSRTSYFLEGKPARRLDAKGFVPGAMPVSELRNASRFAHSSGEHRTAGISDVFSLATVITCPSVSK